MKGFMFRVTACSGQNLKAQRARRRKGHIARIAHVVLQVLPGRRFGQAGDR